MDSRRNPSSFQQLEKLGEGTYATVCELHYTLGFLVLPAQAVMYCAWMAICCAACKWLYATAPHVNGYTLHANGYTLHVNGCALCCTQMAIHCRQMAMHSTANGYTLHANGYTLRCTQMAIHCTQFAIHCTALEHIIAVHPNMYIQHD